MFVTKGTHASRPTVAIEQNAAHPAATTPVQKPDPSRASSPEPTHAKAPARTAATARVSKPHTGSTARPTSKPSRSATVKTTRRRDAGPAAWCIPGSDSCQPGGTDHERTEQIHEHGIGREPVPKQRRIARCGIGQRQRGQRVRHPRRLRHWRLTESRIRQRRGHRDRQRIKLEHERSGRWRRQRDGHRGRLAPPGASSPPGSDRVESLRHRARSSVGERSLHTREVAGSSPAVPIRNAC